MDDGLTAVPGSVVTGLLVWTVPLLAAMAVLAWVAHRLCPARHRWETTFACLAVAVPALAVTLFRSYWRFGFRPTRWAWWVDGWQRITINGEFVQNMALFVTWCAVLQWADVRRGALHRSLARVYAGTTRAVVEAQIGANGFRTVRGVFPNGVVRQAEALTLRYTLRFANQDRCVFVTWANAGPTLRDGHDGECTRFIDR